MQRVANTTVVAGSPSFVNSSEHGRAADVMIDHRNFCGAARNLFDAGHFMAEKLPSGNCGKPSAWPLMP